MVIKGYITLYSLVQSHIDSGASLLAVYSSWFAFLRFDSLNFLMKTVFFFFFWCSFISSLALIKFYVVCHIVNVDSNGIGLKLII